MSDYTLPPVPDALLWAGHCDIARAYGHTCAEAARAPLIRDLAECFNAGGSDADGNGDDWRAANAVRSVRQLRADYDEACDEGEKLRARVAELERSVKTFQIARDGYREENFRLSVEKRALLQGSQEQASEITRLIGEVGAKAARIAELEASVGVWQKTAGYCAEEIKERAEQFDRLRAEVEALRAKIDRAEVSYGNMLRADDKRPDGTTEYTRGWGDCLRAIAARKGEGSEG